MNIPGYDEWKLRPPPGQRLYEEKEMDPNVALQEIEWAYEYELRMDHFFDLDEKIAVLKNWLECGGFEPDWEKCPVGAVVFATKTETPLCLTLNS